MKKMMWPEVAGSEWIYNGHRVKVHEDGLVETHPEVLEIYEKNLAHRVQVIEVDETGEELAEETSEDEAGTSETEEPIDASEEQDGDSTVGPLDDAALRALAKEHDVKLGRTKNRDKIVAKLQKAGVDVPGE